MKHAALATALLATTLWQTAPPPAAAAQETTPPSAEALLDAYANAMGGSEAYGKIKNMVARGRIEMVGMGISGPLTTYWARPSSSVAVFEAEAVGKIRTGTDGEIAWETSDLQGPRLLQGAEKAFALRSGLLDAPLRWRELYPKVELLGAETVDGVDCWKLRLAPSEGAPETWYLDRTTSLLVKVSMVMSHAMGEVPVESTSSDYRRVNGVMFPFRASQKLLTQEMLTLVDTVETNVQLPADALALPAEVRALLDSPASAPPAES